MFLDFKPVGRKGSVLRPLLLPAGVFLLLSVAGLSSSSEADESLFVRSAQQLERLWGGVLGCAESDEPFTVRNRFDGSGGFEDVGGGAVPAGTSRDYSECGRRALRNAGSRMLVNTVENALREGGFALFKEGFRIDSSIGWTWGENVRGAFDAVLPLWSDTGAGGTDKALFLQPGAVFWSGHAEQERIDANIGLVYRGSFSRDLVGGVSVFYDRNFERGLARLGGGLDIQGGIFTGGLNYYHPLDDEWTEGRTDYVEKALRGMDLRLGLSTEDVRFDGSMGLWRFEGEEDEAPRWRAAYGIEGGYRLRPGIFLEAGYEYHNKEDSLDSRWNMGLAFRYSLPGFEGSGFGPSGYAKPDLWRPVEREKRILYEERIDFSVRLETEEAIIAEPGSLGGRPATTTVTGVLSGRDLRPDETLEVVLDEGTTAEYGAGYDFTLSHEVYGVDVQAGGQVAATGSAVCAGSPCRMEIPAGVRAKTVGIEVSALVDTEESELHEHIDMRLDVRDGLGNLVRSSNVVRVTIGAHGNTVGIAAGSDGDLMENGGEATVTVEIAQPLLAPVALQVGTGGTARSGADYTMPADLAIPAGADSASLTLRGIDNDRPEGRKMILLSLSGELPEGWEYAASTHEIVLRDDDQSINFTGSNSTFVEEDDGTVSLTVAANHPLPAAATVAWSVDMAGGVSSADFTGSTRGSLNFQRSNDDNDPRTITLHLNDDSLPEDAEEVTVMLDEAGSSLPEDWSLGAGHTLVIDSSDGAITFASASAPLVISEGETRTVDITSTADGPGGGYPLTVSVSPDPSGQLSFPQSFNLPAGEDGTSFEVTVNQDGITEESLTYTMTLGSGKPDSNGWTVSGTRTISVPASDGRIYFTDARLMADEGGASVTTTLVMNPPPASEMVIPMSVSGNAVEGTDYVRTLSSGGSSVAYRDGIVYPANAESVTFEVAALDDADGTGERAVYRITHFPAGYASGENGSLEVILNDDDIGDVQFATGLDDSANEGESVSLRILASTTATADLVFNWSASPADDVDASSGTVTIRQGRRSGTFRVAIADPVPADPEDAEDVTITLAADNLPLGWALGERSTHAITVSANDKTAGFSSGRIVTTESEESATLDLTLNASAPAGGVPLRVTVSGDPDNELTLSSADGSATWDAAADTFTIGENGTSATLRMAFAGDGDFDTDTYTLNLAEGAGFPSGEGWGIAGARLVLVVEDPRPNVVGFATGNPVSVDEGDTITLTATVSGGDPGVALPLGWSLTDAEDDIGTDSGNITIPADADSVTIDIPVTQDADAETAETFTVTLDGANLPDGFELGSRSSHEFAINAEDNSLQFSPSAGTGTVAEGDATPFSITLDIDRPFPAGMNARITLTPAHGGGASAGDYTLSVPSGSGGSIRGTTWTLPTGTGTATLEIMAVDDRVDDDNESVTFTIGNLAGATGWSLGDMTTQRIDITDNDVSGTVGFASTNPATASEGGTVSLTVVSTAEAAASAPASFNWSVFPANEVDVARGTVTLAGADEETFDISIKDDAFAEIEESIVVTLEDADANDLFTLNDGASTHTITIAASDNTIAFASSASSVAEESGAGIDVVINIDKPFSPAGLAEDSRKVDVTVTLGEGAVDGDYLITGTGYAAGVLTLPAGGAKTATLNVAPQSNKVVAGDKTVTIGLRGTALLQDGWSVGSQTHAVTIVDDDYYTLDFYDTTTRTITEANGNKQFAGIDVIYEKFPSGTSDLQVFLERGGTAVEGEDYRINGSGYSNGYITLQESDTVAKIEVEAIDDSLNDDNEYLTLTLKDPDGNLPSRYNIGSVPLRVNITDNDDLGLQEIAFATMDNPTTANEGDDITLTVQAGSSPAVDLPLVWSVSPAGEVDVARGTVTITGASTDNSETFTIDIAEDGVAETAESITVTLEQGAGFPSDWSLGPNPHIIGIAANGNIIEFVEAGGYGVEVDEGVSGGSHPIPMRITRPYSGTLHVNARFGGDAVAGNDFNLRLPVEITAGSTAFDFPLAVIDDRIDEPNETVEVTLTADGIDPLPAGWSIGDQNVYRFTIVDNDEPPSGTVGFRFVGTPPTSITEGSGEGIPAGVPDAILTVDVFDGEGSSGRVDIHPELRVRYEITPGEDASPSSGVVGIPEDAIQFLNVHLVDDDIYEEGEQVTVTLTEISPPVEGFVIDSVRGSHTYTVTDNDYAVRFESAASTITEDAGTHTVKVEVKKPAAEDIVLNITTGGDATGGGVDYSVDSTVTVPANEGTADITVTVIDDDDTTRESNETIELTLGAVGSLPQGWRLVSPTTHTVTIMSNENIVNMANLARYRIEEDSAGINSVDVVIDIDAPLLVDGSVVLAIEGNDDGDIEVAPLAGSTYDGRILGFSRGADSAGIRVTAVDDPDPETDEEVVFTISENPADPLPQGWNIASATQTLTIEPSDNSVGFALLENNRVAEGGSIDVIVEVNHPLPAERSVELNIDDTSGIGVAALEGSSYINGNLRLAAGGNRAGIRITATDEGDTAAEIAQEINFTLSELGADPLPTGWDIGTGTQTVFVEANNNTIRFASPASSTINEKEGDGNSTTITATIDKPMPAGVSATVAIAPADGSYTLSVANAGHGSVVSNVWTLPTEAGTATLTITAVDNYIDEPDKTVTLGFAADSLPTGWSIAGDVSYDITIEDDDLTGTFQFAENQDADAREGDVIALTVMASQTTEIDVPVTWTITAGGGDVIGADTGTVVIESGQDSATFDIVITDDELAEYAEKVTIVLSDATDDADLWTPDGRTKHDIEIFANDNTIRFEAPSSSSIAENGGVATITAVMDLPIPEDEPSDTNIRIKPGARVERGDLEHFDEHLPDYVLSAAEGNGTFVVLPRHIRTGRADGIWTLPKGVERATLTVTAVDNTVSVAAIDAAEGIEDPDKTFRLGFSGDALPRGWVVPAGTSHEITILDDALPDAEKNVAGLVLPGDGTEIVVGEGGTSSFEIKLSNADGTAYEAPVPGPFFTWFYTVSNMDVADIRDVDDEYEITFDGSGGWGPTFRAGRGNVIIVPGESHAGGLLPLTITITDDEITEGTETFHHLFHEPRGSSGGILDAERWRSDADANEFTLVILGSDNSVEFAQDDSGEIPEAGGSALITLKTTNPIDSRETVTVDLGFAGGTEGTDFEIEDGTATYDSTTKKLTLPPGATEADFTLKAKNNPADDLNKELTLTLSNLASTPGGWGSVGGKATHIVNIRSSTKNFIGFTKDRVEVRETVGTDATVMLQLSKPDNMPFTDSVPAGFSLAYSSPGNEDNDYSVRIDGMPASSTTSTGEGTVQISAQAYTDGLVPVTIAVTNDDDDEGAEEFTYTIEPGASFPADWAVDGINDSFTLSILASDSSVAFAQDTTTSITENDGRVRISLDISNPVPEGNTATVNLGITGVTDADFDIIDGTATYAGGKLTLPTGVTEADFTIEAQDNNRSGPDKTLTLTLTGLSGGPDGWAPDQTGSEIPSGDPNSRSITIEDDDKNTIGFARESGESLRIAVGEDAGTITTLMLQLSNPDGTAYTDNIPADLALQYTLSGTNGDDFSFEAELDGTGAKTALLSTGTLEIPTGQSLANGQVPITITVKEDEIPENVEEFVYTIEADPSRFPKGSWEIAPGANRFTLVITDNDNSISIPGHNTIYNPAILEESAENLEIPVTLNAYAAQNITFNVRVTATDWKGRGVPAGNDVLYEPVLAFKAGDADEDASAPGHQQTVNLVITPIRDRIAENKEEFRFTLKSVSPLPPGFVFPNPFIHGVPPGGENTIGYNTSAFVIPAHDNTITFAADQPATVAEGESITLNVRPQDNELPLDATLDITSDAEDASDITITSEGENAQGMPVTVPDSVTLPEGLSGDKSFTVTANQDADAVSETITIRLVPTRGFPAGWGITEEGFGTHRITIEDDESETVAFDPANRTELLEAEGEVSLRVGFKNGLAPAGGVGLSLSSSDPDLVRIPEEFSNITVEEGYDGFAFTVDVLADSNNIADTVTLTLRKGTDGNGAGFPDGWKFEGDAGELTLEVNIADRGTVGFVDKSGTVAEPGSTAVEHKVPLEFSSTPSGDFSLAFHLASDGAVNDRNTGDFFADTLYTFRAADGFSFNRVDYPVLVLPDDEYERDEGFTLTLAEDQPGLPREEWYVDPENNSYTVTIPINDVPGGNTLGFASRLATIKEQAGEVEVEVVSTAPAPDGGLPLTVTLAKGAGSAVGFADNPTAASYNFLIEQNQSSGTFAITLGDDASEAADEEVTFTLSLQENFPHEWGTGIETSTITIPAQTLTIDDRDDGRVSFVRQAGWYPEPYPNERVESDGCKYYNILLNVSEVPRNDFHVKFWSEAAPNQAGAAQPFDSELCLPHKRAHRITPEDAADGQINIVRGIGVKRDSLSEGTEYWSQRLRTDEFPPGWTAGPIGRLELRIGDSSGGQIWFTPNDTRVGETVFNPSIVYEASFIQVRIQADVASYDSPLWVALAGGDFDGRHPDFANWDDRIVTVSGNTNNAIIQYFHITFDGEREEDEVYSLVLSPHHSFRGQNGRRVDPARNVYTFTIAANGGIVGFHPDNATTLREGEGLRQMSLYLEGGETHRGLPFTLTSSNPGIVGFPDPDAPAPNPGPPTPNPVAPSPPTTVASMSLTIPEDYTSTEYPFPIVVGNDDNGTYDTVTLTLSKGTDANSKKYFPKDWDFEGDVEELDLELLVLDDSSTPPEGTVEFFLPGGETERDATEPDQYLDVGVRVSTPTIVPFNLPIETSGTATFGLGATDDATRDGHSPQDESLPLDPSNDDTIFLPINSTNSVDGIVTFSIQVNDDDLLEGTETLVLTIPEDAPLPEGFTLGGDTQIIINILGNDNAIEFASGESSVTEGGVPVTVAINIDRQLWFGTSASVVMRARFNDGASANDYTVSGAVGGSFDADTGTFTIPAGVDTVTFNVTANDDTAADPGESITFTLDANASTFPRNWGGIGSQSSHTVTIRDNEATSIGFTGAVVDPAEEGGTASLRVNLSADVNADPAEFTWTASPAEHVVNPTGTATLTSRNHTLEITAMDNDVAEYAKEVTVTLTDADTSDIWNIDRGNDTRTFTIPASDNTVIFAAPSPGTISENGGSATITATIKRPAPAGEAPVVAITPGGAGSGDYSFSVADGNGSLSGNTWTLPTEAESAVLTVTAIDNSVDDVGSKTLTLGFADAPSMPTGWSVSGTASRSVAIADDDDAASTGTVQFAHASSSATEGADDTTFHVPVLVSGTPTAAFDLAVRVVDGRDDAATQGEGEDYTVPATLNISRSGSTNLEVAVLADNIAERAETIVLEIPSDPADSGIPAGFSLGATARHTVTINANDNTVGFAAADPLVITDLGARRHLTVNINNRLAVAEHTVRVEIGAGEDGDEPPANEYSITQSGSSTHTDVLTLPADNAVITIGIAVQGDAADIGPETVTLTLVGEDLPDGWGIDAENSTQTVSVNDTSQGHTLGFATPASTVKEQAGSIHIEIRASAPAPSGGLPLTVALAKEAGSKVAFADNPASAARNFTIAEGESWVTFPVTLGDDADEAMDEEVTFTLTLGERFPYYWGNDNPFINRNFKDKIILGARDKHILTIDDRDDGVIGFVDPLPKFREPYPGEATVKHYDDDAIYHPFEMRISEIPREPFDLGFHWHWDGTYLRPIALIYEVDLPESHLVTPEDAEDGRFTVLFGVERNEPGEPTEYLQLNITESSLPRGWSIGEHPHMEYALLDSSGGQVWFAPNDTRVGSVIYNPSVITENETDHTVRVRITTDAASVDTPITVELEGHASGSAVRHPDIHPTVTQLTIPGSGRVRSSPGGPVRDVEFDITVRADNRREEDETYTLVLKEGPGFPLNHFGRRIDPTRNKYTFTIPANDDFTVPQGNTVGFAGSVPAEIELAEGEAVPIPVDVSAAPPGNATVTVSVSGTAEPGDYAIQGAGYDPATGDPHTGILTLSQLSRTSEGRLTFTANSDGNEDVEDETARIELTGTLPSGFVFWDHVRTIRIGESRTVQFASGGTPRIYEGESASIGLRLSQALASDVTIPLLVQSGSLDAFDIRATAPNGANVSISNRRVDVSFDQSGDNDSVTLTMTAIEDIDFGDESITIAIDDAILPPYYSAGATDSWTVNIIDNDKTIEFDLPQARVQEPRPGEALGHDFGDIFTSEVYFFDEGCGELPDECVVRWFNLKVDGIPTEPFNVKMRGYYRSWNGRTEGASFHSFSATEWGHVETWPISAENIIRRPGTSRGRVRVPLLIRDDDDAERSEWWGLKVLPEGLPRGWKLGGNTDLHVVIECNDGHSCHE